MSDELEELRSQLTLQQQRFVDGILEGLNQSQAYRRAYPKAKKTIEASASRLVAIGKVSQYLRACRNKEAESKALSREEKRQILRDIAQDRDTSAGDRVRALQVDNRMSGDDAPVRIEGNITLTSIFSNLSVSTGLPGEEAENE